MMLFILQNPYAQGPGMEELGNCQDTQAKLSDNTQSPGRRDPVCGLRRTGRPQRSVTGNTDRSRK